MTNLRQVVLVVALGLLGLGGLDEGVHGGLAPDGDRAIPEARFNRKTLA